MLIQHMRWGVSWEWDLKGLLTNFEFITFFVSQQKKHFSWKVYLDKPTLTRNNWENCCSKSVRVIYTIYITVLGRIDFEHPIFRIISSQSCFIKMDLSQKMILLLGHEKNVIYSKLVNNPFKCLKFGFKFDENILLYKLYI